MKNKILSLFFAVLMLSPAFADEGMWIPLLLEQTRYKRMQELGLQLTPEDIYNINRASLKDAIVLFGGGCSGVVVSEHGLLLTNHHCGYRQIQSHSSLENDYLTDGFWASSMAEELPNPGLNVAFLLQMEDVTEKVLQNVTARMSERQRADSINAAISRIRRANLPAGSYRVNVRPLYKGNQYFMYVYEIFNDVRLVGAPPSAIGKFGGDTDNWMWPRHTGDFAFFRIYADKDNRPADYSPDNVPYRPKQHIQVTTNGVREDDFTMVYGYPGSTNQYISSYELNYTVFNEFPMRVAMRTTRLAIMDSYMRNSREIAIQYAAKHSSVSNSWKRLQGTMRGITQVDGLKKKQEYEDNFRRNLQSNPQWMQDYGQLLEQIKRNTEELSPLNLTTAYYNETISTIELVEFAGRYDALIFNSPNRELSESKIEDFLATAATFYKDYSAALDKDIFVAMMKAYYENVSEQFHFNEINAGLKKHKGSFERWANEAYSKSVFRSYQTLREVLTNRTKRNAKAIENDPFLAIFRSGSKMIFEEISMPFLRLSQQADSLQRIYMAAQLETDKERIFYPDANHTLRVAFGTMKGYSPMDAVKYLPYTTLEGVMEKDNPDVYEFKVPEALKTAYNIGDFDRYSFYAQEVIMPVCFIASNHTSGGNSGSPVLNYQGELLGLNFDRTWESTMSDFVYDVDICRNITVDVRYILYITHKVYGAEWIVEEMNLKCDCE